MGRTKKQQDPPAAIDGGPIYNIWGWTDIDAVAADVYSSIHSSLLEGLLVFAYQGTSEDLSRFVITQRQGSSDYMLGVITQGYTMYLPHVPREYLRTDFMTELKKKFKINELITSNLEKILR